MSTPLSARFVTLFGALAAMSLLCVGGLHGQAVTSSSSPLDDDWAKKVERVTTDVEKLRGWRFKRPVRQARVSAAEASQYFARRLDEQLSPQRRRLTQAFLRTAGLIPRDCDLASSIARVLDDQVAGYYDPATSTLYIVERREPMPALIERSVLAHELTHALDDQYAGLRTVTSLTGNRTEDMDVVVSSLGEGSATALMMQYMRAALAQGDVDLAGASSYLTREMARARALLEMPRYFSAMFGSYIIGTSFLARGDTASLLAAPDDRQVGERFLAAWKDLPHSSEQILHPSKYWDAASRDEPVVIDDASVERWLAGPGRFIIHRNTLGELLTAQLTAPRNESLGLAAAQTASAWTNEAAAGWGGDRFYLLASGATAEDAAARLEGLKGAWVTAWDTPSDRDEFLAAFGRGPNLARVVVPSAAPKVAVVLTGFDDAEVDRLSRELEASPLRMTKNASSF